MKVSISIYTAKEYPYKDMIYYIERDMDIVPNIGDKILLDLDDPDGWCYGDEAYCEWAECYERMHCFEGDTVEVIALDFIAGNTSLSRTYKDKQGIYIAEWHKNRRKRLDNSNQPLILQEH